MSRRPALAGEERSRVADYLELTKPRLSLLVLATTLAGYLIAAPGQLQPAVLVIAMLGTTLVVAGANTMNQVYERRIDALMARTRNRPLPAQRLWAGPASVFGLALASVGVATIAVGVNALAAGLAAAGFVLYALVYTPLKRITALCTFVGAIPGAIPPIIGWAAATGTIDAAGAALFLVLFLWQMPHFFAIARLYREDYRNAGMVMLGLDERGAGAYRTMIVFCIGLLPATASLTWLGATGAVYLAGAMLLGGLFLAAVVRAARVIERHADRTAFLVSIVYLWSLLGLMLFDRVPRP